LQASSYFNFNFGSQAKYTKLLKIEEF
jgi:hypothetical protein